MSNEQFYHGTITALLFPRGGHHAIRVGEYGVTAITEELHTVAEMVCVSWFNVQKGNVIAEVVNAAHVETVVYETPANDDTPF